MAQEMKNLFLLIIACVALGIFAALNFFLQKGTEPESFVYPPPPEDQPTPTQEIIGPTCYIDRLNQFSLQLPEGWRTDGPPDTNAVGGASVFYNYSRDEIKSDHGFVELPPDAIKVHASSAKISDKETFEQWISAAIERTISSEQGKYDNTATTSAYEYTLAGYSGLAYSVTHSTGTTLLSINLLVDINRVLIITITPANSPSISDALAMLETLKVREFDFCYDATDWNKSDGNNANAAETPNKRAAWSLSLWERSVPSSALGEGEDGALETHPTGFTSCPMSLCGEKSSLTRRSGTNACPLPRGEGYKHPF